MHKVFGEKAPVPYYDRKGAYLIPVKDNKIAVIKTPKGLFFLGGGIENGETDEACIRRECLEESGVEVTIGEKIGSAETFTTHPRLGPFHPIQTYYAGDILKQVQAPLEKDHTLLFGSFQELTASCLPKCKTGRCRNFGKNTYKTNNKKALLFATPFLLHFLF